MLTLARHINIKEKPLLALFKIQPKCRLINSTMQTLETVTMGYDPVEDRIFMRAKLYREEAIVRLWLTPRLLSLLVPHLVSRVEDDTNQPSRKGATSSNATQSESLQSNNTQIENDEVEEKPTPVEELSMYLIDEVVKTLDIKPANSKLTLIFVVKETKLSLMLNQDQLKKWLLSLYRLSQQPQWSLKAWPAWIAESERQSTRVSLH